MTIESVGPADYQSTKGTLKRKGRPLQKSQGNPFITVHYEEGQEGSLLHKAWDRETIFLWKASTEEVLVQINKFNSNSCQDQAICSRVKEV